MRAGRGEQLGGDRSPTSTDDGLVGDRVLDRSRALGGRLAGGSTSRLRPSPSFRYSDEDWTDLGALTIMQHLDPDGRLASWAQDFVAGMGGANLIPVAVARDLVQTSPVAGSFAGSSGAFEGMSVEVSVAAR